MAKEARGIGIARLRIAGLEIIVLRLRERPDVIFREQAIRRGVGAAAIRIRGGGRAVAVVVELLGVADLIKERFGFQIPHLVQPVDAEARFAGKVCGVRSADSAISGPGNRRGRNDRIYGGGPTHLARKIANANFHQRFGVANRFDILHVITGIPPSAGNVSRWKSGGNERSGRRDVVDVVVVVERRCVVDGGVSIIQVAWSVAQGVGDIVRAVAFGFVEKQSVEQQARVENVGRVDGESGRVGFLRAFHGDRVDLVARDGEVQSVNVVGESFRVAPGADKSADGSGVDFAALRVGHGEAGAGLIDFGHEVGAEGTFAGFVAGLVNADPSGLRVSAGCRHARERG